VSYVFYASPTQSSDNHLLARLVLPANSTEMSELRRWGGTTTGTVLGRLESVAVSGTGLTTFLGRVISRGYLQNTSEERIEEVKVAVLESFGGTATKETSIVPPPPALEHQGESPRFIFAFRPSLEIGETYLFVAEDGTALEYAASDGSTRQFSGFIANLILSRDSVPLQRLRSLGREHGDRRAIVIAKADKTGFEARATATPTLEYRFDYLPPGSYSFAVEAGGIVFVSPQSAEVRSGGCAAVSLTNLNYFPSPVADCSAKTKRAALCDKFPGAQFIFKAE